MFSWRNWAFSLISFAAAASALYIALAADLPRPYWAAATAYIVSQPSVGALRAKALWRLVGTLCGGTFAVVVVPNLVNSPYLLCLVMAVWLGVCVAGCLYDGTLRSYAFMLAGYTAPIIAFPSVDSTGDIFMTAVSRVEEISLGIVCAFVLHSIFMPSADGPVLRDRMQRWFAELRRYCTVELKGSRSTREFAQARHKLITDGMALDALIDSVRYEVRDHSQWKTFARMRHRARQAALAMASVAARYTHLHEYAPVLAARLDLILQEVQLWLTDDHATQADLFATRDALLARVEHTIAVSSGHDDWYALVNHGLLLRLEQFIRLWSECEAMHRGWQHVPASVRVQYMHKPRDRLFIFLSGAAAACALMLVCVIWRETAWPSGASAVIIASVAMSIFAHMDDPLPALRSFFVGNALSTVIAGIYVFGVFPGIDGFPLLVSTLAVFFLPAAVLQRNPAWTGVMIPMVLNLFPNLALHDVYSSDLAAFLNSAIASLIGIGIAVTMTAVLRSMGGGTRRTLLAKADHADLVRLATGRRLADIESTFDEMIDRFAARITRTSEEEEAGLTHLAGFSDVRAGHNMVELHGVLPTLSPQDQRVVRAVLNAVARHVQRRRTSESLQLVIDRALRRLPDSAFLARMALSGLRLALLPQAPPPVLWMDPAHDPGGDGDTGRPQEDLEPESPGAALKTPIAGPAAGLRG